MLKCLMSTALTAAASNPLPIDRAAVVARHNVHISYRGNVDPVASQLTALTVGNGEIGFTADVSGLQSFNATYHVPDLPLYTLSNWGWHSPDPKAYNISTPMFQPDGQLNYVYENVSIASADTRPGKGNRTVPYQLNCPTYNEGALCRYQRDFPARINLGQMAFILPGSGRAPRGGGPTGNFHFLDLANISAADQRLDMWTGVLQSNWTYSDGGGTGASSAVSVDTVVDTETDTVSTRYAAPAGMGLGVQLAFSTLGRSGDASDWSPPGSRFGPLEDHNTTVLHDKNGRIDLFRELGADTYSVSCTYTSTAAGGIKVERTSTHAFAFHAHSGGSAADEDAGALDGVTTTEISCRYQSNCCVGPHPPVASGDLSAKPVPAVAESLSNAASVWQKFWTSGAFVDISSRTADPRAFELERRTIQSLFIMRSQEAGSVAPQESGLLMNSWTGKHHNEMRYWHQTWMPIWGHPTLLARSDQWFIDRLDNATAHTARQGYRGARWGKMLGESNMWGIGRGNGTKPIAYWESPNNINPALVWHQPHVIYMAELEYRASTSAAAKTEVLNRMKDVVLATAAFIADFPERRLGTGTNGKWLDLGPPLQSASEGDDPYNTFNPTYELTQFNFSLDVANSWRERLGLGRSADWDYVRMNLAPQPVVPAPSSGKPTYNRHANCLPSVFSSSPHNCTGHHSHPALNGALGCLPGDKYGINREIMNNTLHETLKVWSWSSAWGWDQPMVAMTATRLEQPEIAVDALLMNASTNVYLPSGYNHPRRTGEILAYLPGNGGTLIAVGLMAGGWADSPAGEAPGFPAQWKARAEGFTPYF